MKRNLLLTAFAFLLFISIANTLNAQKWVGNGDGTSWNDGANWDSNEVPPAGAILKIGKNVTITGNVPNNPAFIKILKDVEVIFDLDMNIGDGIINQHAFSIAANSTLTFGVEGNNRSFVINTPKHGLAIFNANDDAKYVVASSTTLHIGKAGIGVNIGNVNSTFINNGTITVGDDVNLSFKVDGSFVNNSLIEGSNIKNNGVIVTGTFNNNGNISLTALNDTSRLCLVDTLGTFENSKTLVFDGGKDSLTFLIHGTFTNMKDAYLTVNSGGVDVSTIGEFTNTGLVTMDAEGLFITSGTSTNNGFYNYASGSLFSTGDGTIIDNGLTATATVDAAEQCTVDLAEAAYEWFIDGASKGNAGDDGSFTFGPKSLTENSTLMTTSLTGVNITVNNICDDAVDGGCGVIASPVSLGDEAICLGETTPTLKVQEVTGYVADWYDTATGGTAIYTGWEYTPSVTEMGVYTYYVENREDATGCLSDRTEVTLTINAIPTFSEDSTKCSDDNTTYTVFLSINATYAIESSTGTVNGSTVTGIPAGTDAIITVTNPSSGCSYEETVTSPDCTVGTYNIDASYLHIYPTIVTNNLITIEFDEPQVEFINIYNTSGKLVQITKVNNAIKNNINVSDLKNGLYFIKTNSAKHLKFAKFIMAK